MRHFLRAYFFLLCVDTLNGSWRVPIFLFVHFLVVTSSARAVWIKERKKFSLCRRRECNMNVSEFSHENGGKRGKSYPLNVFSNDFYLRFSPHRTFINCIGKLPRASVCISYILLEKIQNKHFKGTPAQTLLADWVSRTLRFSFAPFLFSLYLFLWKCCYDWQRETSNAHKYH